MKPNFINPNDFYSKLTGKKIFTIFLLLGLLLIFSIISILLGSAKIEAKEIFYSIFNKIFYSSNLSTFNDMERTEFVTTVLWQIRLPRIVMTIIAGIGLAIAGATMQGILRNPLVSPYTLGVSSAAGFGAALAIILGAGIAGTGKYLIIGNAFLFALLAVILVLGIARLRGINSETVILAGVAIMFLFSALTSFLQYIALPEQAKMVVLWLIGSLHTATWDRVLVVSILVLGCVPILLKYSWDLNALASGDETAKSLGVNVKLVTRICVVIATLITAGIICFTGTIGFICLVSPHIARLIIGGDHRFLLPCSSLTGAVLLIIADTLSRTLIQPTEIPVGIITSFIGVPFFIFLLLRKRRQYW